MQMLSPGIQTLQTFDTNADTQGHLSIVELYTGTPATENLTFDVERPLALEQRRSLLLETPGAERLLLLCPREENVFPAIAELNAQGTETSLPPSILLLHALELSGTSKAARKQPAFTLAVESPAIQRFTLRLIIKHLQRAESSSSWVLALALQSLEHTLATANAEAKLSFFRHSDLVDAITDPTTCARVVQAALKNPFRDSALERSCLQALIARVLTPAEEQSLVPLETISGLLPFMDDQQLTTVWDQLRTGLESSDAASCVSRLCIIREALELLIELPQVNEDDISRFLAIPEQFPDDVRVAEEVIAIVTTLMRTTTLPGVNAFMPRGSVDRQGRLDRLATPSSFSVDGQLAWLQASVAGSDALLAALIHKSHSAAAEFANRIGSKKASNIRSLLLSHPMSLRAFLDVQLAISESSTAAARKPWLDSLVETLPSICFEPTSPSSQIFTESAGLLSTLLARSSNGSDSAIIKAFVDAVPDKPGDAFQLGAVSVAASLAAREDGFEASRTITAELAQLLIDRGLAWLVRRFAEDDFDSSELLDTIDAFASLIFHASRSGLARPKPHLADPVIEAGLKRRLTERRQMEMLRQLVRHTPLKSSSASSHFATLLAHPHFNALAAPGRAHAGADGLTEPVGRSIVISLLHCLASQHPATILTTPNVQALLAIYGGTLSLSDRLLFDLFQRMEQDSGRASFLPLARSWTGHSGVPASSAPLALDALLSLDPSQTLNTCSGFPRCRDYGHIDAGSSFARRHAVDSAEAVAAASEARERQMYDPLWVLSLLLAVLNEDAKLTGLQWLSVVRLNVIGVAICALSSKSDSVRALATLLLGKVYESIKAADMQERDHLLLAFDALRDGLPSQDGEGQSSPEPMGAPPILPLTTTLFFAHHLRAVVFPASILYPLFSRFLLQRPAFDISDVPLLYTTLQSTDPDHWRGHRVWMLRFLRDCLSSGGSTREWRVMKRRYLWDLLASMYTGVRQALHSAEGMGGSGSVGANTHKSSSLAKSPTTVTLRQTLALLEDVMLSAAVMPPVATELLMRKGLLPWIAQQLALERSYSATLSGRDDGAEETSPQSAATRPGSSRVAFYVSLLHSALIASTNDAASSRLHAATSGSWLSSTLNIIAEAFPYLPSLTMGSSSAGHPPDEAGINLLSQIASLLCLVVKHAESAMDGGAGGGQKKVDADDVDMASPEDTADPAGASAKASGEGESHQGAVTAGSAGSAEGLWALRQVSPLVSQALARLQAERRRLELESDSEEDLELQGQGAVDEDDEESELARARARSDRQRRRRIIQEAAHDLLECCLVCQRHLTAGSGGQGGPRAEQQREGMDAAYRQALEMTLALRGPSSGGDGQVALSSEEQRGRGGRDREHEVEAIRRGCVRMGVS